MSSGSSTSAFAIRFSLETKVRGINMISLKKRCFKEEFSRSHFTFDVGLSGDTKDVFVQSKIECIRPAAILVFRLITSAYLLFGVALSITSHASPHCWFLYMTSIIYFFVLLFFISGIVISFHSVFLRKKHFRSIRKSMMRKDKLPPKESKENVGMTVLSSDEEDSAPSRDPKNCSLSDSRESAPRAKYTVDAIICDIEENSKRLSIPNTNQQGDYNNDYRHAILHDNQLPSLNIDVPATRTNEVDSLFKVFWFFSCVSLNLTAIGVIIYWLILFPSQDQISAIKWYLRVDRHGLILIFLIIDHMISRTPIRILHFVYPAFVFVLYGITNALYTYFSGDIIYESLNFKEHIGRSIVMVAGASFVGTPIMHFLLYWVIHRFRERIFGFH